MRHLISPHWIAPILSFGILLCGCSQRRIVSAAKPAPAAQEEEADGGNHEAVAYFRERRWRGPGELPAERYHAAQRRVRQHDDAAPVALGTWQPLGPTNVGARTKALVFDPSSPNTLYAATSLGGIWKTTDAGQNWAPLTDSLPTLAMNTLAIDPSNPGTLYAGSGEVIPGAGIFKTTDGGQTWTQLAPTAGFAYVYSIVISPSQSPVIYAGTDSGLWYSSDAGVTWTNSLAAAGGCYSVAATASQASDIVFAACSQSGGNPFGYFHSENRIGVPSVYTVSRATDVAGGNWEVVLSDPNMGPTAIAVAPSAPSTVYALAINIDPASPFLNALLGLYASNSAGAAGTWQQRADLSNTDSITANILSFRAQSLPCTYGPGGAGLHPGQGAWNLSIAVDPTDSQTIFTAGYFISRSQDGGRTFTAVATTANVLTHVDHHGFAFPPGYNARTNQTIFAINDGGVYRSDLARTQSVFTLCSQPFVILTGGAVNNGLQINQFYGGSVTAGGGVYVGGTQDTVTLLASAANPSTWTPVLNGDGGFTAFDPLDANTIYYEYQHRGFSKSTDGGNSNLPATTGITDDASEFPFLTAFTLDPRNSRTLYLGVNRLYRSADGAQSWASASPDTGASVSAIAVNPADSTQVLYGDVNGAIYNGTPGIAGGDGTWSNTQPRSGYVSHFAFDPNQPGWIYATYATFRQQPADSQIYLSKDGGASWQALGTPSLPDIPVHTLVIDPDSSSTLYIGTDIGILVSFDSGTTWGVDTSFLPVVTDTLQMDRNGAAKYLYAFTFGRGLWRVNLTPGVAECSYTVSPNSFTIDGNSGQMYSVNVVTAPGCAWAATAVQSTPYNLLIQSPASGIGPGTFYFTPSANYSGGQRTLQFSVQDQVVTIQQGAATVQGAGFDELTGAAAFASLPYLRTGRFSTLTSNRTDPVHSCTGSADLSTAWFGYRAPADQRVDVSLSANGLPVVLAVYGVQNGARHGELGCVTNRANVGMNPSFQFDATTGNFYVFEVAGVGAGLSFLSLTVQALPTVSVVGASTLAPGASTQFTSTVTGTPNTAVRWMAMYGSIDANGNYTAPVNVDPATPLVDTVTAISFADPNATGSAQVTIQK